jgi:trimeric autotransporter adhesin
MKKILFNLLNCRKTMLFFTALFFSIASFAQPGNDDCANATSRTSSTSCNVSSYTLNAATASAGIPGVPCVAGVHYDEWFKFTAVNASETVKINNLGSSVTNPEVAIFSGTCGAGLVQEACGTTTTTATTLTIGNNYYVRVSNVGSAIASNGGFDICITHPAGPPANDECINAISRTSSTSCNNKEYNLKNSTASAAIPGIPCVAGVHYDIWFSFTAVNTTHTATISNRESNFTNPEVAIFNGPCGALLQLSCGTTTSTVTGLIIGNTYYVRVSNVGTAVTSNGKFDICITHPPLSPANDDCSGATTLTSTPTPTCSSVTANIRYATSNGPAGACGGATLATTFEVWFKFVATSTTHAVTISNLGSNFTAATTYIELLSGTCGGALASLGCQAANITNGRITNTALTIGTTYYVRVYVLTSPTSSSGSWNFDICVQHPPVNDLCANFITLAPGAACTNTAGTLDLATTTVLAAPNGCVAAGTYYDVWYKFVATAATHTVTLSGMGANFTAPRINIYTGACGLLIPVGCASATSLTQATIATVTYYVQIANFGVNPSGTGTAGNFDICITGAPPPPGNDGCAGAITLISGPACSNLSGTLINATASVPVVPGSCGLGTAPDVWFSFVAQSTYPQINLSTIGALMQTNGRVQLLTGSCSPGPLTPVGTCHSIPAAASTTLNTVTNPGGAGLTIGQTYYIRITHNTLAAPVGAGTYTWNICVTDPVPVATSIVDYAKSYINLSSGIVGGTINPGDSLEIRATLVIRNTAGAKTIDSVAYYDTLKAGMGFRLRPGTIATRTNEGKLYQSFSDNNLDAGWYTTAGAGSDTSIQINLGPTASRTGKGALSNSSKPNLFTNTACIIMATYRVNVTAGYGTKINYGGGSFVYRDASTGGGVKIDFPKDSLMVYQSVSICPNIVSQTNILGDEFNGTFGSPAASPASQNRGTSLNTTYAYMAFNPSGPNDYFYAVPNNTSSNNSTLQTVVKPSPTPPRVFGHWDISGDHTGAPTIKGNKPCDPLKAKNDTITSPNYNPCGYMLVVNAAYRTDVAFSFTVAGACPNTYYEIAAWVKNICYKCGCDINGVASTAGGYIPSVAGAAGFADSSGVRPNLAFEINGVDYYTTGDIPYQGLGTGGTQSGSDTLNKWVRKSFIYKTGLSETNFLITLRNNAPGGGGNDWALDDISLRTCYPNMSYSPSSTPSLCANSTITIRDTVRSIFNTYVEYKWQRSTNGGTIWVDIAGTTGTAPPPPLVNGMYEFVTTYTIPPAFTTLANSGNLYRVVVATTPANLASTCNFSDVVPITITINNCLDIDDDNDGIPDYVEFNNPVALADSSSPVNGIPNWKDPTYPGFVDNDLDGVNDNFDYGADANNNGIPNYKDPTFLPWIDSNADGVNDLSDKDLDGIPNQLDRDSDNDGIPDTAESYGVDTNGDGIIDTYTDTDGDGFSQNVDANSTGVQGSGNGLGAPDFDGDGIPNYLDTDSDNDGIPDLVEAGGADTNNNGKIDVSTDGDADGIGDNYFMATALLKTGVDVLPLILPDGKADDWPNKNLDRDFRPNAYDVDSDGDGIVDVIEAGLPDVDLNGIVDGTIVAGGNGWSTAVSSLGSLGLRSTDADGKPDYLDIDTDADGIPDNIEGQSTASYRLPTLFDVDGDGLTKPYDSNDSTQYSGAGIFVYDHNANNLPDYRDLDSDGDGLKDIREGNDFNLNGLPDDNVTPTGLDDDGDGLDNRFDSLYSFTNIKGTSYRMGNSGSFTGDAAPGSRTTVQRTNITQTDRDWRYAGYVLPAEILSFSGLLKINQVPLSWMIITSKEIDHFEIERSIDNNNYAKVGSVYDAVKLNQQQSFGFTDDITGISNEIIYYRIKIIGKAGDIKYSSILIIRKKQTQTPLTMMPNPANNYVNVNAYAEKNIQATFTLIDKVGKKVLVQHENLSTGFNNITLNLDKYSAGVYALIYETGTEKIVKQLIIVK